MTAAVVTIFLVVYLGMVLGGLPFLQLDRTGVALLGAVALIGVSAGWRERVSEPVLAPPLVLLWAFMGLAAQVGRGGFYDGVPRGRAAGHVSAAGRRGEMVYAIGGLS